MIYLDTSVALAALFSEARQPPAELWSLPLISSRLIEYEMTQRILARKTGQGGLGKDGLEAVGVLLGKIQMVEMTPNVLARAREPFPVEVKTLDALHLATAAFLVARGQSISIATYDKRMVAAAKAMKLPVFELP